LSFARLVHESFRSLCKTQPVLSPCSIRATGNVVRRLQRFAAHPVEAVFARLMPMLAVALSSMQVLPPAGAVDRISLLNLAALIVGAVLARVLYGVDRVRNIGLTHWLRSGAERGQCIVQYAASHLDPALIDASARRPLDPPHTNGGKGDSQATLNQLSIHALDRAWNCLKTPSTAAASC
jgi:hypothetical protein